MINHANTRSAAKVISKHRFAEVILNESSGQKALHASAHFTPGEVICQFSAGLTLDEPSYLTVQIGDGKHITLEPDFLQYINHSCDPTVFFDTTTMELVCLKALHPGDEFTFFYPSTEWEMAQPFTCYCGTRECIQLISGASHLAADILNRYRLTDFIQHKIRSHLLP